MSNKNNNIKIETKNFYLRQFNKEDHFDVYYNFWNDKNLLEFVKCDKPWSKESVEDRLRMYESLMNEFCLPNFAVFTKETEDFVGSCGMSLFHNAHGERNPLRPIKSEKYKNKEIELRYVLYKKYWNEEGYAIEIIKACIDFVFDNYSDIKRIVVAAGADDITEQKFLSKIGFESHNEISYSWYGKEIFHFINKKKDSSNIEN